MGEMELYRAKWLVVEPGVVYEDGAILVKHGRVLDSGRYQEVRERLPQRVAQIDCGDNILFPGLLNAHAHLEFTCMRGAVFPSVDFTSWLERMGHLKRSLEDDDYLRSIADGIDLAARSGTTTVFSMISFPQLLPKIAAPRIRVWWFYEISDIRHRLATDELIQGALMFFERRAYWPGGFGISPHSPYTASPMLYDLTRMCSKKYGMPWVTHVGESASEYEMFAQGSGSLYEFMESLGREMRDCGGNSPLRRVLGAGEGAENGILVHLNYLDAQDEALLATLGGKLSLVHCPSSHRFFGHRPFAFEKMDAWGVRIALGTDSGATSGKLDLRDEMSLFLSRHPLVSAIHVWKMVTTIPAAMVRSSSTLGHLRPGAKADFVLWKKTEVPPRVGGEDFWRSLIEQQDLPLGVWVGGQRIVSRE